MRPVGGPRREALESAPTTAPRQEAKQNANRRTAHQTLAVALLALGIASICFGLYSLIQAFDVFDLPMPFKVWFSRALVALVIGVIALHVGGKRVEAL